MYHSQHTLNSMNGRCWHNALSQLEHLYDQQTYIYILQSISRIINHCHKRRLSVKKLSSHIRKFDRQSKLNGTVAQIPIHQLINDILDLQYIYPLCRHELSFPYYEVA